MANRNPNNYIINDDGTVSIELRRRNKESLWTIIDIENLEYVTSWTWYARYNDANNLYYASHTLYDKDTKRASTTIDLQYYLLNRDKDSNISIDHINHNTLDNRILNLRKSITKENTKHRSGRNSNNKTGYRNVFFDKRIKKRPYIVQLQIEGKNTRLGSFSNAEEAGKYAEEMRQKYYGEFAGEG